MFGASLWSVQKFSLVNNPSKIKKGMVFMIESKNLAFDHNYQMIVLMTYDFASPNVGISIQRGDQNSLMFTRCSMLQKQGAWEYCTLTPLSIWPPQISIFYPKV
jgi:hypothetical protein